MKHLIFIAFLALILAPSCKKDNTNPIKTLTSIEYQYSDDTSTVQYTYDEQGRLLTANDGENQVTYAYANDEITIREWRNSENREVFYFKGTLDANGHLSSGTATSKYSANTTYEQTHEYEYDANGYLVKARIQRANNQSYAYRYYYTGGNLTKYEFYTNDVLSSYYTYEYTSGNPEHSSLPNVSTFVPENTFMGKTSAQKPVKYTRIRSGSADESTTNTYTTDEDGYVVKQTSVPSNGTAYTVFYHFE